MKTLFASLFIVAGFASQASAITCSAGTLVQWPSPTNPTWEMCVLAPNQSSGAAGSGMELRTVYYKGKQVFKRANNPIVNVNYVSGCGCYRDWMDEERKFEVFKANPIPGGLPVLATGGPGAFVDAVQPPRTACDNAGVDVPAGAGFLGVAIERLADRLRLTTQLSAGWYRYLIKWTFHANGVIEPRWGFGAVQNTCVQNFDHRHQAYWRFDFDIDGAGNDGIGVPGKPGRPYPVVLTEEMRVLPDLTKRPPYVVHDTVTRRGYWVQPGPDNLASPVGSHPAWGGPTWQSTTYPFEVADMFLLQYKEQSGVPLEVDDGVGFSDSQCAVSANFLNFMNNDALNDNGDVVGWLRGGAWHAAGALSTCAVVGPTLTPVGEW